MEEKVIWPFYLTTGIDLPFLLLCREKQQAALKIFASKMRYRSFLNLLGLGNQ
ncbi:hypothetical protein ACLOJK_026285 [Asimina triloba]